MTRFRRGVMTAIVLCCGTVAWPQDEGLKKVEQLVKKAKATVAAIGETKAQLGKTMEVYNGLVAEGATDRKGAYKKLQQEMAATDERRAQIGTRAAEMDLEADAVFKSWAESLGAIGDADLRKRSEDRLASAREKYAQIKASGKKAADLYAPVMKALQDQVTFLGHDLTPGGIASLKPATAKLNADVQELTKRIDETIGTANAAIAAIAPQ